MPYLAAWLAMAAAFPAAGWPIVGLLADTELVPLGLKSAAAILLASGAALLSGALAWWIAAMLARASTAAAKPQRPPRFAAADACAGPVPCRGTARAPCAPDRA
jgi:hypothetical protein